MTEIEAKVVTAPPAMRRRPTGIVAVQPGATSPDSAVPVEAEILPPEVEPEPSDPTRPQAIDAHVWSSIPSDCKEEVAQRFSYLFGVRALAPDDALRLTFSSMADDFENYDQLIYWPIVHAVMDKAGKRDRTTGQPPRTAMEYATIVERLVQAEMDHSGVASDAAYHLGEFGIPEDAMGLVIQAFDERLSARRPAPAAPTETPRLQVLESPEDDDPLAFVDREDAYDFL